LGRPVAILLRIKSRADNWYLEAGNFEGDSIFPGFFEQDAICSGDDIDSGRRNADLVNEIWGTVVFWFQLVEGDAKFEQSLPDSLGIFWHEGNRMSREHRHR